MLNYEYPPLGGGASPVTYNLARELVRSGVDIDIVTMGYRGLPRFEQADGVNIYRVPCIRRKKEICHTHEMLTYDVSAFFFVLKLMQKNRYDLNHTHFIIPTGAVSYLLKKFKGLPYIITSHGSDVPGYNPDRFSLMHTMASPFWKKIVQNAEQVITPSKSLKDLILKIVRTDKVEVIPHGFDYTSFNPKKKENKILLVSRLFERKGFQYFLDAIRELDIDYEINVIGDGPYKETLIKKAQDVKAKVNFLGWMDNTSPEYRDLYERSSIFVFPSSQESFGVVLQEAMSAKMAIISSNIAGCAEAVGDAALFVRPRNSENIKKALLNLINNGELRKELGKKARKRVEEKFSWGDIAQNYYKTYESLV